MFEFDSLIKLLFLVPFQVPEVEEDTLGPMDTVFVWFRYVHAMLVPILIFILHKGTYLYNLFCLTI